MLEDGLETKLDSWELLILDFENKYPIIMNQIKKVLYSEDREKVLDIVISHFIEYKNIINFRISRDDNNYSVQNYKKVKSFKIDLDKRSFDSSIFSTKNRVCYYFGFAHD
jgi:hypothetical protein